MSRVFALLLSLNEPRARDISEYIREIEIRRCIENRTKMGSIHYPLIRVRDELFCRTLPNLAGVTNVSVSCPITGSPSIYEVLAVLRKTMARRVRERRENRERKRRM